MKLTMGLVAAVILMTGMRLTSQSGAAFDIASPTISAPVTGGDHGQPFGAWNAADVPPGYLEEERFMSGTAASFTKAGTWGIDGR
jgi:hypothetical protein